MNLLGYISIAFYKKGSSSHYLDGSVAFVCQARGDKLSYKAAELQKSKYPDLIELDGTVRIGEIVEEEELIPLLEEPYEEAFKIVRHER